MTVCVGGTSASASQFADNGQYAVSGAGWSMLWTYQRKAKYIPKNNYVVFLSVNLDVTGYLFEILCYLFPTLLCPQLMV
jgi:hypothetical protein